MDDDLLTDAMDKATAFGSDDSGEARQDIDAAERAVRESLARIRRTIDELEMCTGVVGHYDCGRAAMRILTPDDRRLLGMDE